MSCSHHEYPRERSSIRLIPFGYLVQSDGGVHATWRRW